MVGATLYLRIPQKFYDEEFHNKLVKRLGNRGKEEM